MKKQLDNMLKNLLGRGVEKRVFPGGAAGVSAPGIRAVAVSGHTRLGDEKKEVTKGSYFDIASLTKPLATTLLTFVFLEEGLMDLDDCLESLNHRDMSREMGRIRVRDLLHHSSGLCGYRPYYLQFAPKRTGEERERLIRMIVRDTLEYDTGTESRYSDPGFMLLGELIRHLSGSSLDHIFREKITVPLGLEEDVFFLSPGRKEKTRFVATEICGWRKRLIQGEVHDEHCWLLEGVSGHAGLFATIGGVLSLTEHILERWLDKGKEGGLSISSSLLRQGLKRQKKGSSWCLGFDTPTPGKSSAGSLFSPESVGHLGYTGTSFWIDPEHEIVVVLLTNRVHPSRDNIAIREFRPWFHDNIMKEYLE